MDKMEVLVKANEDEQALPIAKESLSIAKELYGADGKKTLIYYHVLARIYSDLRDNAAAEPIQETAFLILRKNPDFSDQMKARVIGQLGLLYYRQSKFNKARNCFREAMPIDARLRGENDKTPNAYQIMIKEMDRAEASGKQIREGDPFFPEEENQNQPVASSAASIVPATVKQDASAGASTSSAGERIMIISFLLFFPFLTLLKATENKVVFFIDRKDRAVSAVLGVIILIILGAECFSGRHEYTWTAVFLSGVVLWNANRVYRVNPGMILLPLLVALSRAMCAWLLVVMDWLSLRFLKKEPFALKEGENEQQRIIRFQAYKGVLFQTGVGILFFNDALFKKEVVASKRKRKAKQEEPVEETEEVEAEEDADSQSGSENVDHMDASSGSSERDEIFDEAVRVVMETGQASAAILQRRLSLGFSRAGRIMDQMEQAGIIGPYRGSKPREILIDREEWLAGRMGKESKFKDGGANKEKSDFDYKDGRFQGGTNNKSSSGGQQNKNNQQSSSTGKKESPYEILGVSATATMEEVKTAYRKKMMESHPDRTAGLGEKFKELAEQETKKINEAYETIKREKNGRA
ncbi:MAG: DNA translocase FtsK, partial [Candidatus Omnitrophota bacterium]